MLEQNSDIECQLSVNFAIKNDKIGVWNLFKS